MARIFRFRRLRWPAPPKSRTRRKVSWGSSFWIAALAVFISAGGVNALLSLDRSTFALAAAGTETLESANFSKCARASQTDCVVDGDTFRYGAIIVRIADIDTPEARNYHCASELALGRRATARLQVLMNAGPFSLRGIDRDEDVYGRKLRIVVRDGRSLGETLVAEGLARVWDGARHPWCS